MARSAKARVHHSPVLAVAAFVATALAGASQAATLTVGPVEQVNLKASTLVVLGQTYRVSSSAVIRDQSGALTNLGELTLNTLVAIDGSENSAGKVTVDSVTLLSQMDVPGATRLLVTGLISSETTTGKIRVGNLSIDVNSALTGDTPSFGVGDLVQVSGTQPSLGGLFLAQSVAAINGIAGTGHSANGIAGTGVSIKGIAGTGHYANGIAGTGFSSNGIAGTGHSANGIAGTGVSIKGIAGTGHYANGIAGTGFSSNGIAGTGHSANGIAGTGSK